MTNEYRVLDGRRLFNIEQDADAYCYPDDMVDLLELAYTVTPSDPYSYEALKEMKADEHRAKTRGSYPQETPTHYVPRGTFFQLYPRSNATVVLGGRIFYYRHSVWLASEIQQVIEVPDFLQDLLVEGMIFRAERAESNLVKAQADEEVWEKAMSRIADRIEDRAHDARPSIRPPGFYRPHAGMI